MGKEEIAIQAAQQIVRSWESIDARVDELARVYDLSQKAAEQIEKDLRSLCGGKETYEACKAFLAEMPK